MHRPHYEGVPQRWHDSDEHLRKLANAVRDIQVGKQNNVYDISLTPGATSTVVVNPRVCCLSVVLMTAQTQSASEAAGVWAEAGDGEVTFHHDASPDTDRTFGYTVNG
jgi:hypothetical protein